MLLRCGCNRRTEHVHISIPPSGHQAYVFRLTWRFMLARRLRGRWHSLKPI